MNRWSFLGAIVFGGVFALFTFWRIEAPHPAATHSQVARFVIAAFLLGFYCAIVIISASGKKRSLSLSVQTLLAVTLACAIAALFGAGADGYALAVLLGLVLGFTADKWVEHVPLP